MSLQAGAKVCIKCREDCSTKPRTKDGQGRYTCRACLEAIRTAPPSEPPPESEVIPFADDALPAGLLEEAAPVPIGLQTCPECQSSVPHGSAICVQCGFDLQKGKKLAIDTSLPKEESAVPPRQGKCGKCGYSVKGLREPRCPECGTLIGRLTDREKRNREHAQSTKWAYLKPLIQFGIGFGVAAMYFGGIGEPEAIAYYAIKYIIHVPIGAIVFLACCLLWIGFDAPVHLLALRLAGVYALVDLVTLFASLLPLPLISYILILGIYIGLLADSLDLDLQDAIIVGVVTWGVKFVIAIVIAGWLMSQT